MVLKRCWGRLVNCDVFLSMEHGYLISLCSQRSNTFLLGHGYQGNSTTPHK